MNDILFHRQTAHRRVRLQTIFEAVRQRPLVVESVDFAFGEGPEQQSLRRGFTEIETVQQMLYYIDNVARTDGLFLGNTGKHNDEQYLYFFDAERRQRWVAVVPVSFFAGTVAPSAVVSLAFHTSVLRKDVFLR
jgi:hypothetical protein